MMYKIAGLFVVLAVVAADPVPKLLTSVPDDLDQSVLPSVETTNQQIQRIIPDSAYITPLLDIVHALIGYKFTALGLGVLVIEWLISNALIIFIGGAAAVGLCKITGKCNLNYEAYVPISHLKTFVTPEYLETAEKFLVSAVEKYAEKKGRDAQSQRWLF